METIDKLPVFGYRGNTYFFNVYPLQENYPDEGGIFIFAKRVPAPNALYTVIYVGHAHSFNSIKLPKQCDCLQSNGINTVCLMPVQKEEERQAIAQELEERLRPVCNTHANN